MTDIPHIYEKFRPDLGDSVSEIFDRATCLDYLLVRAPDGSGGWSLHPRNDDLSEVSDPIVCGPSNQDRNGDWSRPNRHDYSVAAAVWKDGLRGVTLA